TYNGKAFDVPFLRDRMLFHRVEGEFNHEHLDLLWEARRRWKGKLPDFRLQTLELNICRRRRANDIPGNIIPELYHEFVRTGNARLLQQVFHHNALDLITMAELLPAVNSSQNRKS
ncbi:MAG: ribonuclease H-like domain-containing protein, partial [Armatimonadota bacterium]